ncbi:hypothetical protein [Mycobacteroides abscessus]|uniref:hypothetical protein n=1 Tax=Mycobacteroides abscessus TaxID=36809 RepID=UPI0021033662|nr:hypothetical protein [Mycobacteroides abscessus]
MSGVNYCIDLSLFLIRFKGGGAFNAGDVLELQIHPLCDDPLRSNDFRVCIPPPREMFFGLHFQPVHVSGELTCFLVHPLGTAVTLDGFSEVVSEPAARLKSIDTPLQPLFCGRDVFFHR